jgi:hypothetical protein
MFTGGSAPLELQAAVNTPISVADAAAIQQRIRRFIDAPGGYFAADSVIGLVCVVIVQRNGDEHGKGSERPP